MTVLEIASFGVGVLWLAVATLVVQHELLPMRTSGVKRAVLGLMLMATLGVVLHGWWLQQPETWAAFGNQLASQALILLGAFWLRRRRRRLLGVG